MVAGGLLFASSSPSRHLCLCTSLCCCFWVKSRPLSSTLTMTEMVKWSRWEVASLGCERVLSIPSSHNFCLDNMEVLALWWRLCRARRKAFHRAASWLQIHHLAPPSFAQQVECDASEASPSADSPQIAGEPRFTKPACLDDVIAILMDGPACVGSLHVVAGTHACGMAGARSRRCCISQGQSNNDELSHVVRARGLRTALLGRRKHVLNRDPHESNCVLHNWYGLHMCPTSLPKHGQRRSSRTFPNGVYFDRQD